MVTKRKTAYMTLVEISPLQSPKDELGLWKLTA